MAVRDGRDKIKPGSAGSPKITPPDAPKEAGAAMKKLSDETQKSRLNEIADITPEEHWWLAPRSTTSLRFLDVALQKLEFAVDGADAAPSADARASWAQLRPAVDAALRAWSEFKAKP